MSIEWQDDLSLGIPELDEQHHEIFRRFAAFSEACQQEQGREALMDLLSFMHLYATRHFASEEQLMAEYHYPGLEEQMLHQIAILLKAGTYSFICDVHPNMTGTLTVK